MRDRDAIGERNPMRDDEDMDRRRDEDIIGEGGDEDFEEVDELEEDEDLEA
jgi:hypothetical protein